MNLLKLRRMRGLPVNQLSKMAGVSSATIAKIERGEKVRIHAIRRLAEALECQPSDIDPDLEPDPPADPHLAILVERWVDLSYTTRGQIMDMVERELGEER